MPNDREVRKVDVLPAAQTEKSQPQVGPAAAKAQGDHGFGAHWAGQGAPLARVMQAAQLVRTLREELQSCWA